MKFFENIMSVIFKRKYSAKDFQNFHSAPRHRENWIFSLWDYRHPQVKKMIRYLKNRNDFLLKKEIAKEMYSSVLDYLSDQQELSYFIRPLVLPVPISKKRMRERGFNQTDLLAKYFAQNINGEYRKDIIQKHSTSKKQALIKNRKKRFENVHGVFSARPQKKQLIKNRDFIVIDDLSTTGATLMEIRKVLKKNGARNIIAVTIAH